MSCNYTIGALSKEVYLIPEETIKNQELIIDVNTPSTTLNMAYKLKCMTVNMTEETQKNGEKTEFIHQIVFRMYGLSRNLIGTILSYNYFGFRTEDGEIFVINPQLPIKVTYDVELDENSNLTTTFTCAVKSNFPFVPVNEIANEMEVVTNCSYDLATNIHIEYEQKCYVTRNGSTIKHIAGKSFKEIDFLPGTVKYMERYDGKITTEELNFNLPVNSDMEHYEFVEHNPKNRWSFIVRIGSYFIPIGFNNGMVGGYSVEENNEAGGISMTFTDKYDCGLVTDTYQTITKTTATGHKWEFIKDKSKYYDTDRMQYILQQKFDAFGNKLDEYKSFGDLTFDDYNIVGHFEDIVTYEDQYAQNPYYVDTNLTSMTFYKLGEEKTFTLKTNYAYWSLSSTSSSITISPDEGGADQLYTITITNGIDPEDGDDDGLITINITDPSLENPEEQSWNFYVKKKPEEEIFPSGTTFSTDYKPQFVVIPFNCVMTAVSGGGSYIDGNNIIVPLKERTSALSTNITITATTEYGEYTLHVQQNGALRSWVVDGSACDGQDLRQILRLIIAGERTNQTKFGSVIQSDYCKDVEVMQVENGSYCDGTNAWTVLETRESYDNFSTYKVINKTLGNWLSGCSIPLTKTYVWEITDIEGEYNGECCLMYKKRVYYGGDQTTIEDVIPWQLSANGTNGELPIVPCG